MDPNMVATPMQPGQEVCPFCHQAVQPNWYFCPNCGNKLHPEPLKTDAFTQAWIYAFSIALPMLCFLFVTKWPGFKYLRSRDEKVRAVGMVATALLVVSTIGIIWLSYVWIQQQIQSATSEINADMSF